MIIIDGYYISQEMIDFLNQSQIPILATETAKEFADGNHFNMLDRNAFLGKSGSAEKFLTISEESLQFVDLLINREELSRPIDYMKNKLGFRSAITEFYPEMKFLEISYAQLKKFNPESIDFPCVLKMNAGYSSKGVYLIHSITDWQNAVNDVIKNMEIWKKHYSSRVIRSSSFIVESYLTGDEYAIDGYYDENGNAVLLNIMQHVFADNSDVSDRLYYTSKPIIQTNLKRFTDECNKINSVFHAKNFPFHLEVRKDGDTICPIEMNPLRFAGLFTTDLSYFAWGFKTYEMFFQDGVPDFDTILANKNDEIYSMIVLEIPDGISESADFDYSAWSKTMENILCWRPLDKKFFDDPGVAFACTRADNYIELENMLKDDLKNYYTQP